MGHPPSLNGPGSQGLGKIEGSLHGLLQEPWYVVYQAVSMMVRLGATNEPCEISVPIPECVMQHRLQP